jgi:hypothetical protein
MDAAKMLHFYFCGGEAARYVETDRRENSDVILLV